VHARGSGRREIEKGVKEKEKKAPESGLSRYNRRRHKEHEEVEGEGAGRVGRERLV
jgi:hypothetical protein